jgi:hypothetical protein
MSRSLKTIARPEPRPDAAALLELATTASPTLPPAVMPSTGSGIVNLRLADSLIDELDAAADAAKTTRKVIVTRALAAAGYRVPQQDLEDRTPKRRRGSAR